MYFDQVVEIGHYQLGIKGKKVLIVYDEDIDDFYHHYINFIQNNGILTNFCNYTIINFNNRIKGEM